LRDRERQALMVFYEALGGPDWIERDSRAAAGGWESGTA
jgi:hypothetical protein